MHQVKIFKGWPPRHAPSKLVKLWYKTFPLDQRVLVEMKNPTRLCNKTSNARSCAEDQILESFREIHLPVREHTWLIGLGGLGGARPFESCKIFKGPLKCLFKTGKARNQAPRFTPRQGNATHSLGGVFPGRGASLGPGTRESGVSLAWVIEILTAVEIWEETESGVGDNLTGGRVWGGVEPGSGKNLGQGEA